MHVKHANHAKHGCLHVGGHLQFPIYVYMCVCACVCMRVHVCVCGDTLTMPQDAPDIPPHPPAPPQSRSGARKQSKFNK